MKAITVQRDGNTLFIGENPMLVVNLISQQNYIVDDQERIPYMREVAFSEDLINGERKNVFESAIKYYYVKACEVYEGMKVARAYREKMNIVQSEIR